MQKRVSNSYGRSTVNYEAKIKALKEKGIFSDEQASRLSASFEKKGVKDISRLERTYLPEIIGVVLLVGVLLYIFIAVGSADTANGIEDVAHSLNGPVSSGIAAQHSFFLLLVLLVVLVYVMLYLYARNRFRMFWRSAEEMRVMKDSLHHTEVMKKELTQKLERLLKEEDQSEITLVTKSTRKYVMETLTELEAVLYSQKEQLNALKAKCRERQHVFPDNLAKLVGRLPSCQ